MSSFPRTRAQPRLRATRTRDRIARRGIEEFCAFTADVVEATRPLASSLVTRQLTFVRRILLPHQATTAMKALMPALTDELRERAWLTQAVRHNKQSV